MNAQNRENLSTTEPSKVSEAKAMTTERRGGPWDRPDARNAQMLIRRFVTILEAVRERPDVLYERAASDVLDDAHAILRMVESEKGGRNATTR
jgi:hypothetical protein